MPEPDQPEMAEWEQLVAVRESHDRLLTHLREHAPTPFTAGELAASVDAPRRNVHNHLNDLQDAGAPIATKTIGEGDPDSGRGGLARLWWFDERAASAE